MTRGQSGEHDGRDDARAEHQRKVERVAAQLRARKSTRPISLRKKGPSHQVPKGGDLKYRDDKIDIGALDAILDIDVARRVCVAEPGVTFARLVDATLAHGLVPLVVPELRGITIGGAVSGCSLESMSFEVGGFHDTCLAYEVITAAGDVITCTRDNEHRLVFQMMHGAFGTLGILSLLTFRLVPALPYVHVTYERHRALPDYLAAIRAHTAAKDVTFMDGIVHAPDLHVLSVGEFVAEAPYTSNYEWLKVYYQSTAKRRDDYLPTRDYFFRYDRGVTNVRPKSFIGRLLLGRFVRSEQVLKVAEKVNRLLPRERPTITLDVFVPSSRVLDFFAWYRREIDFFPLWIVPYRRVHDYEWVADEVWSKMGDDDLFIDIAMYGLKQPPGKNLMRLIEEELARLGGVKTLIAHNYYSEDEFWRLWNKGHYDAVKAVTDPNHLFRDLYTKTCRAARGLG